MCCSLQPLQHVHLYLVFDVHRLIVFLSLSLLMCIVEELHKDEHHPREDKKGKKNEPKNRRLRKRALLVVDCLIVHQGPHLPRTIIHMAHVLYGRIHLLIYQLLLPALFVLLLIGGNVHLIFLWHLSSNCHELEARYHIKLEPQLPFLISRVSS